MTNNTHQVADFDSIVGDDLARTVLTDLNLMPSAWGLPEVEQQRILNQNLKLWLVHNLSRTPARHLANRVPPRKPRVEISQLFLESTHYELNEKRATIIHEVGHEVNPPPKVTSPEPKVESSVDQITEYMHASSREAQITKDADIDELYADDYARYCGLQHALRSALHKLYDVEEDFKTTSTLQRIARLERHDTPLLLNLIEN
jgi:hypothetical protein